MIDELAIALEYLRSGLSVIPVKTDGSKQPDAEALPTVCSVRSRKLVGTWEPFIYRTPSITEIIEWFAWDDRAIGIVGGAVSGGLEVIDFDDGSLFEPWKREAGAIVDRLPVVSTGGGGWHVFYRCSEGGRNCKIAIDPSREKPTLIETRGQGGFVVAVGSPKHTHSSGKPYVHVSGPKLTDIPTITPSERRGLWTAARTFDCRPEHERAKLAARANRQLVRRTSQRDVHPVIAAFYDRNCWDSILTPHGWTTRDGEHWTRPGKQFGISARVMLADDGSELLTVFSGNAGPLSPTGSYRSWNKFDAWAALNHRGDNRAAFQAAREVFAS